jgi:hypothetical protein
MPYKDVLVGRKKALERYRKNKAKRLKQMRAYNAKPEVVVSEKARNQGRREAGEYKSYYAANKSDLLAHQRERRIANPAKQLWSNASQRAKKFGTPFDISPDDIVIPTHCPVFGKKFVLGQGKHYPWAPSLDRIIPKLGYVKGNIAVISHRANVLKGNASVEELEMLANWLKRITLSTTLSLL